MVLNHIGQPTNDRKNNQEIKYRLDVQGCKALMKIKEHETVFKHLILQRTDIYYKFT